MDCSILGFPVHHQLPELAQTYVQSSKWCHPTILSSVIPFSSHLQSFPTSGSLPVSQFFTTGGQSTGASASASIFPMNIQDWFPLELTGWLSLQSKGLSRVFSNTTGQKYQFFSAQLCLWSKSLMITGKTIALTRRIFVDKVISLLFNMLSRFVIACLPRGKNLLILWLQSLSTVILEHKKIKSVTASTFPLYLPWSDGNRCHDFSFFRVDWGTKELAIYHGYLHCS